MDTVFLGGSVELGCTETGGKSCDQTKELTDGYMKMPLTMKAMLLDIVEKTPTIVNKVHIVGYMINGKRKVTR